MKKNLWCFQNNLSIREQLVVAALVRTLKGRFEWRVPDASANPYLATAALIAAGLDGIDRQLDPGAACTEDLFKLSLSEVRQRGIEVLPQNLDAAIDALQADEVIAGALGETLCEQFSQLKRAEWTEYARHVKTWRRSAPLPSR